MDIASLPTPKKEKGKAIVLEVVVMISNNFQGSIGFFWIIN
jgi:hypothetical protein